MPLEPKNEYSAKIYAEMFSAIGAKLVELTGPTKAIELFSKAARPVGENGAKKIMKLLGIRPGNAASAALAEHAVACILGMKMTVVQIDPKKSVLRAETCPYGQVIARYNHMLICYLCTEYAKSVSSSFGANLIIPDKKISTGNAFCEHSYECASPTDQTIPNRFRIDLAVKMARVLADRNELMVSTLSDLLTSLEDVTYATIGRDKAVESAKNAYSGGAYQGPMFANTLGISDAPKLAKEVRDTIGCKTNIYYTQQGFTLFTKKCPQKAKCTAGGFIEAACTEYTLGLLSKYGNYAARTDATTAVCKQDFMQTSPRTDGEKNAA